VIVDLGSLQKINVVRIAWAEPYAKDYRVQIWSAGEDSPRRNATKGIWQTFPAGLVTNGQGGDVTIRLTSLAVSARYLRVWMMESSNTCDTHGSGDPRNCVGYAIRELYAAILAANGTLQDLVKHVAGGWTVAHRVFFGRPLAYAFGHQRARWRPGRLRFLLHQRHYTRPSCDDTRDHVAGPLLLRLFGLDRFLRARRICLPLLLGPFELFAGFFLESEFPVGVLLAP